MGKREYPTSGNAQSSFPKTVAFSYQFKSRNFGDLGSGSHFQKSKVWRAPRYGCNLEPNCVDGFRNRNLLCIYRRRLVYEAVIGVSCLNHTKTG
jgi:hypothetical protein